MNLIDYKGRWKDLKSHFAIELFYLYKRCFILDSSVAIPVEFRPLSVISVCFISSSTVPFLSKVYSPGFPF